MYRLFFATALLATVLGLAAAQWVWRPAAVARNQANARAVLDEAIKAQGGDAALSKIVAAFTKVKGWVYHGETKVPYSGTQFQQGIEKGRCDAINQQTQFVQIEIMNGNVGWLKSGDQPAQKLEGERLEAFREFDYQAWAIDLIPLKENGFRLSSLGEFPIGGRKAIGILVSHDKHAPLEMYFDKETHLLVQTERRVKEPHIGLEIQEKCVFSDYRDVQGTKQPFRCESFWNGEKIFVVVVIEMKLYDKPLDEKLFAKP
jgi:hypothetical protein